MPPKNFNLEKYNKLINETMLNQPLVLKGGDEFKLTIDDEEIIWNVPENFELIKIIGINAKNKKLIIEGGILKL